MSQSNGNNDCRLTINENMRRSLSAFVILQSLIVIAVAGCKSPFDRTRDASGGGGTGAITGGTNLVVFSNELKTGGGAFLFPGGENQTLSFNDTSNPVSARSIRYVWNGGDVSAPGCTPNPLHVFAGFDLMHTALFSDYATTKGRDLHAAGYGKVTFFARGSLSANTVIKIEVAAPGSPPGCVTPPVVPCITLSTTGTDGDPGSPTCSKGMLTSGWGSFMVTGITSSNL
jgi:hypothetical protein